MSQDRFIAILGMLYTVHLQKIIKTVHSQHTIEIWNKLWVLAGSETGYTCDCVVYIGKTLKKRDKVLGYDVLMK